MNKMLFKNTVVLGLAFNVVITFSAPPKPPIEAFEACQNAQQGNQCEVLMQSSSISGICRLPSQQFVLVCVPDQHSKQRGTKPGYQSSQSNNDLPD